MESENMKRTNNILIAALAGIALSVFAVLAQAEVKGGEKLLQLNGSSLPATVSPGDYKPTSCPKCQDISLNARDITSKGASALMASGAPAKTVVSHGCKGCNTTTATVTLRITKSPITITNQCAETN
jgi:hypothetical protein